MQFDRRGLLGAIGAGTVALGAEAARATPVLSASNFGLTYRKVSRENGWLEIDAAGFEANIGELRKMIGPSHPICAVMKGDAYGHSIALLIPSIKRAGVDCVGITSNEEARVARQLGYRGRIARLRTATPQEIEDGLRHRIEELTGNLDHARAAAALAAKRGRRLDIHFALNSTGMGRNGLDLTTDRGRDEARALMAIGGLKLVGIMSHFPVEDPADVRQSLARFIAESDWAIAEGKLDRAKIQRHVANTYATFHVPEARLDMVRVGGGLYGDGYAGFEQFQRIMTAKSRVATVNRYPAGSSVNYDRTYRLTRDSWLANVPVGYADGYRRGFSFRNTPQPDKLQTHALIRGHRVPVIGRVTMNTIMLDATDFQSEVQMDDEVVFFGKQGSDQITAQELEAAAATLNTEVYLLFGNSMPRVLRP